MPRFKVKPIVTLEFKATYMPTGAVAADTIDRFTDLVTGFELDKLEHDAGEREFEIEDKEDVRNAVESILAEHNDRHSASTKLVAGEFIGSDYWYRENLTIWYGAVALKDVDGEGVEAEVIVFEGGVKGYVCISLHMVPA